MRHKTIEAVKERCRWSAKSKRQMLLAWQRGYNERWMVGRHGHRSPAQVRRDHHAAQQRMAA